MSDWKRNARASVAGLMLVSITTGAAFGYPDDKDKPKSDLTSVLEKVPPEVREKIKAEMDKIRAEAEKVRNQAMEIQKDARIKGERIQRDAMQRAEEIQRDAKVQIERVQNEVKRAMEARDKQADRNQDRPDGGQRNEVRREMRVEVRKEGDGEPQVQIFENGKPVQGFGLQSQPGVKFDVQMHPNHPPEMDLSNLPPEKREVIEKARKEFKEAEGKLKAAAEKLAKAEGRDHSNVVILRADGPGAAGMAHGQVFVIPADGQPPIIMREPGLRLPNIPLPPGVGLSDRMPRPPGAGRGNPDLEKRVSKAEKALDDILEELKRLRDDDDDDEQPKEHKGKDKKKKSGV